MCSSFANIANFPFPYLYLDTSSWIDITSVSWKLNHHQKTYWLAMILMAQVVIWQKRIRMFSSIFSMGHEKWQRSHTIRHTCIQPPKGRNCWVPLKSIYAKYILKLWDLSMANAPMWRWKITLLWAIHKHCALISSFQIRKTIITRLIP